MVSAIEGPISVDLTGKKTALAWLVTAKNVDMQKLLPDRFRGLYSENVYFMEPDHKVLRKTKRCFTGKKVNMRN